MEIGRIPPTTPQKTIGSAEENLLELTKEMVTLIEKLKEALCKERADPSILNQTSHVSELASNLIDLDKVAAKAQKLNRA